VIRPIQKKPSIIDCFCGAGGMSLGFKQAGFESVYAFDSDPIAIETYKTNLQKNAFVEDIKRLSKSTIYRRVGSFYPDVIIGGPPCQGFSVQRRGVDKDARNNLVLEFLRLVKEFEPKFFVMENVGGLLAPRGRKIMEHFRKGCEGQYFFHLQKLCALDFGVAQDRRRVFIIGEHLNGKSSPRFSFPQKAQPSNQTTVRMAIHDLMLKTEQDIPNHRADKLSPINLKRIISLSEGQGRDSLPVDLQLKCHSSNKNHRHLDVYGRMWWDRPAPTITARFDSFSRGRFGHPVLNRTITLREGARLQTFPDNFVFCGSKVQVARQIGNAVPPKMARTLAEKIYNLIQE
jgi:DNA (cytosine-5)-methyltransferase 1